ncbi:MFS transporter [Teichococcus vastitatis]|uniref:MFS transporter n=1 Tax=Teichococcus vastitatis TaxID=2307076 RepID=A0ABS9W118_9PROT|nr:MFS transporter [Pseudoroseomonas vastitatis]MCI0752876.1 MFS transporter [Pseudoroseomonas vastitatis]
MSAMAPADAALMKRNVWLLFLCQALTNASTVGQVAMSALIGHSLATDKSLATLPMALQMAATMAASIPAGIVFARLGRRAGFVLGAAGAFLGSIVFALGVWTGSFPLYCLGAIPAGLGFGISQHYRFAAAEVATPAYRPRAVALVMAGGILSAIFGPELVKHTRDTLAPFLFLGTYLILALLPLICVALLSRTVLPPPPPRTAVATPLREILARPAFVAAALTGAVAYGTMNLVMTATPLEMMLCGFGIGASATVIQLHAVSMFAPGFVSGRLIARFGARRIILVGTLLSAACAAVALSGERFGHFSVALMLLGVGWNFMFVGATTLLSEAHRPEERVRAQAANDFIVFGTVACTAFASGAIHAQAGWTMLNLLLFPALALALGLMLLQRRHALA